MGSSLWDLCILIGMDCHTFPDAHLFSSLEEVFLAGVSVAGSSTPLGSMNGDANSYDMGHSMDSLWQGPQSRLQILIPHVSKFGQLASVVFL